MVMPAVSNMMFFSVISENFEGNRWLGGDNEVNEENLI